MVATSEESSSKTENLWLLHLRNHLARQKNNLQLWPFLLDPFLLAGLMYWREALDRCWKYFNWCMPIFSRRFSKVEIFSLEIPSLANQYIAEKAMNKTLFSTLFFSVKFFRKNDTLFGISASMAPRWFFLKQYGPKVLTSSF